MSYDLHDVIVWEDEKATDGIQIGLVTEIKRRGAELTALTITNQKGDTYTVANTTAKTVLKSKEVLGKITTDIKITGAIHLVSK